MKDLVFTIDVNPPRGSVSVDEGETQVNRAKNLPLQHLGLVTTEIEGPLLKHEVTLVSVCVCEREGERERRESVRGGGLGMGSSFTDLELPNLR